MICRDLILKMLFEF